MTTPQDNFFSKAFADGKVIVKTMNLMTQLSKLKLEIRSKKQERDRLMRTIGVAIWDVWKEHHKLESSVISNVATSDLETIRHIDDEIRQLTEQAEQVKADFRAANPGAKIKE